MRLDHIRQQANIVAIHLESSKPDRIREVAKFVVDLAPYLEQIVLQTMARKGGSATESLDHVAAIVSVARSLGAVLAEDLPAPPG